MRGDILTINGHKYKTSCELCYQEKVKNEGEYLGIKIGIRIIRLSDGEELDWNQIKGSYLADKITDFVQNTINGQRSFYWDWKKGKQTEEPQSTTPPQEIFNSCQGICNDCDTKLKVECRRVKDE